MTDLRTAAQRLLDAIDRALPEAPLCSAFDVVADTADDLRKALAYREDKAQAAFEHWLVGKLLTVTAAQVAHAEAVENLTVKESLTAEPCNKSCAPGYCYCEPIIKPEIKGHNVKPPPEAQTEAEKIAYCAGWWAAMEAKREQAEPVAWRTFDGEGGYDYRTYDDNENYRDEWDRRNPNHKGWVEPLYTHPPRREWRGLSEEEVFHVENNVPDSVISDRQWTVYFASALDAALRRKNHE
jgi:hypothetical protein